MRTVVKLDSKVVTLVEGALAPHAKGMFEELGGRYVGLVELHVTDRSERADDDDSLQEAQRTNTVRLRIERLEIAVDEDAKLVTEWLDRLQVQRTAEGTFDSLDPEHPLGTGDLG